MDEKQLNNYMAQMFIRAKAQFGSAVIGTWTHDLKQCPGCKRKIGVTKIDGGESLSLNGFMYRRRGILIGYGLCNRCSSSIHRNAKRNPNIPSRLHHKIEDNLEQAYEQHLSKNVKPS